MNANKQTHTNTHTHTYTLLSEYAVKTIVASGKNFNECLIAFQTEAQVSWMANQAARKVTMCV